MKSFSNVILLRHITLNLTLEYLYSWHIQFINQIIYARLISVIGWMLSLPVWYFIINKIILKNNLPKILVIISMVYIITMPPFIIFIAWASCMELFIACTSGVIAGYLLYVSIKEKDGKINFSFGLLSLSSIFALISLFTYQSGFSCFFIPFFIDFIAKKKITKTIIISFIGCFIIYLIYYLIFRFSINLNLVQASSRTVLSANPLSKLLFLFARPLAAAFHFTYLFNDKSIWGIVIYLLIGAAWFGIYLESQKKNSTSSKLIYLLGLVAFFVMLYLPSLLVKENYASNRTLFALNLGVFLLVAQTVFSAVKNIKTSCILGVLIGIFFISNAWYNYNKQFLQPLVTEYKLTKTIIDKQYNASLDTIYFIRPAENSFQKKYGIVASWDEFGVPSTAKSWVPEPLLKQLIFEKTGNLEVAENVIIKSWQTKSDFQNSAEFKNKDKLVIDFQEILDKE